MHIARWILVAGLATAVPACELSHDTASPAGSSATRLGRARQRIVNGSPSTAAHDATVMLSTNGQLLCTGTLISPNLVLTARHCVSELDEESECGVALSDTPATSIGVSTGVNASAAASVATGKRLHLVVGTDSLCGADIALLKLNRNLTTTTPATIRFSPVAVGETTTAVGYGDDGNGNVTPGRFRRASRSWRWGRPRPRTSRARAPASMTIPAGDFQTTESTCFGDSGGPLFDARDFVVGVTSRGVDDTCVDRPLLDRNPAAPEADQGRGPGVRPSAGRGTCSRQGRRKGRPVDQGWAAVGRR